MSVDFYICTSVTLIDREMAMKPTEKIFMNIQLQTCIQMLCYFIALKKQTQTRRFSSSYSNISTIFPSFTNQTTKPLHNYIFLHLFCLALFSL